LEAVAASVGLSINERLELCERENSSQMVCWPRILRVYIPEKCSNAL